MEEKVDLSKPGPKPSKKLFDTTNYVFREVDMSCVKSKVWKHFLRDKKNGVAQCKVCKIILKSDQSTSALNKHLKVHKIELKTEESAEEPAAKRGKIQNYFGPKEKPLEIQELLAKMSAVDGISFGTIAQSESLHYVFQKAGYTLPKSHNLIRDKVMGQYESIKAKIVAEISEAKEVGIRLSITCDESTSVRNQRFMDVNAHFETVCKSLGMARVHGSLPGIVI